MTGFQLESPTPQAERVPVSLQSVDLALTAQLLVAWAGELGDPKRLGWWRSDLVSEFGGMDLFQRLLPATWPWAVLQAAREAAARKDAELRRKDHDPDRIVTLFRLGFALDERIDERLQDLKRGGDPPPTALPGLALVEEPWDRDRFLGWVRSHGDVAWDAAPVGRRIRGPLPPGLDDRIRKLVAALAPLVEHHPLPHFRTTP